MIPHIAPNVNLQPPIWQRSIRFFEPLFAIFAFFGAVINNTIAMNFFAIFRMYKENPHGIFHGDFLIQQTQARSQPAEDFIGDRTAPF